MSFFGYVGKRRDKKAKVNFKIYDVIDKKTNNYNTYTTQCQVNATKQWK